jgi:cytochrome c-type biogenesis protein CcmH/NrfG
LEAATPKHAVTPAPTLPALELLGDLLLELHRAEESETAYRESLVIYPGRWNSLLGAARAATARKHPEAKRFYRELLAGARGNGRESIREEARVALSRTL